MASLPLPGPGPGDDHQGLFGLNVSVRPVSLVAHDGLDIGGVPFREAVSEDLDVSPLELVLEELGRWLVVEPRDHDPEDIDAPVPQVVDELQGVGVVGYPEIGPDFLSLDVAGIDAKQDVGLVLELLDEPHLDVGVVAGQDAGRMVVVKQLAAELEVELVVKALYPLKDLGRLLADVFLVVEADLVVHVFRQPPS